MESIIRSLNEIYRIHLLFFVHTPFGAIHITLPLLRLLCQSYACRFPVPQARSTTTACPITRMTLFF
jgi:hypothetical protein